jgi:phage FluMu gp28-like protein
VNHPHFILNTSFFILLFWDPFQVAKLTASQKASLEKSLLKFRQYQEPVFRSKLGMLVLHWSRQIGKSFTLAAWAVRRLIDNPGRLVTVLSNSKSNGQEFILKASEVCNLLRTAFETVDLSSDDRIENMRMEIRITIKGKVGRIIVLAANPRTARGFSGDLILDEFAFHEDSAAIWDAAEPIISSNPDYLCRIASTGNGRFNMFYQMANESSPYTISRIRRSEAYRMGVKIYDPATRAELSPDEARAGALDKASYDQNYECAFNDENMALLTQGLISACEYSGDWRTECFICSQDWSNNATEFLRACAGPLCVGLDVGRTRDITVITVGERIGGVILTRAILRISAMRLPQQLERLRPILRMPNFGRLSGDATGLGLGLLEFAQEECGAYRVEAVQFASREKRSVRGIEQGDSALVTELMALDLLDVFESRAIRIPCEGALRDSLRKPERIQNASGVRIAATRDEAGHADEFWSIALMIRALSSRAGSGSCGGVSMVGHNRAALGDGTGGVNRGGRSLRQMGGLI